MHDRLIAALSRQLERIADTYEADLCWRKKQAEKLAVETHLSVADKALMETSVAIGAALVKRFKALAAKFKELDASTK